MAGAGQRKGPHLRLLLLLPAVLLLDGLASRWRASPEIAAVPAAAAPPPPLARRLFLGSAAAAGLVAPLAGGPLPAHAEQAWQLRLPRAWKTFDQNPAPPPDVVKTTALVVAGDADTGGELVVLRVPLQTTGKPEDIAAAQDLISYFSTPLSQRPKVPASKAVEAVAQSQRSAVGLTKFDLIGSPKEYTKGNRRYVRYEYESSVCQGIVTQGTRGSRCELPDGSEELPLFNRRHSITMTATPEGQPPVYYLWLLDVSTPPEGWANQTEAVDIVSESFEVGEEAQLEQERTLEVTKEQLEALEAMKKAGKLPMDE